MTTIRCLSMLALALCLATKAMPAQAADHGDPPWMVLLEIAATPDDMAVRNLWVTDCYSADHRKGGDLEIKISGPAGEVLQDLRLLDPRLISIESPDKSHYEGPELVRFGSKLMPVASTHFLSLPLAPGPELPLPARIVITDEQGAQLVDVSVDPDQVVPADQLGCQQFHPGDAPPRR
jgi:hypothetical protein